MQAKHIRSCPSPPARLPYHRPVTSGHLIDRAAARRFLVIRHMLAPPRALPAEPESVMRVVERLGSLQFDPLEVAGRNHDLVLLARIDGYRREWTDVLLYRERRLFEAYNKQLSLLPTSELPWYRIAWDREHRRHHAVTFPEHAEVVAELLERIRADGPLSSIDVKAHAAIDWYWRPTNRVRALLEALAEAGILGIARRAGNRRYYDLIERLYPPEILAPRPGERVQLRHKMLSRYRAHGLLGAGGQSELWAGLQSREVAPGATGPPTAAESRRAIREALVAEGVLVPVEVEGIRGMRYVVAEEVPLLEGATAEVAAERAAALSGRVAGASAAAAGPHRPAGRAPGVAFLAPLDPLAWDRDFLRSAFGFDYVWEVYVPAARRRWGYYVLPILFGDRLVGRIEPRIDRAADALRVVGLWWEDGFDPFAQDGFVDAFVAALEAHRQFAGLTRIVLPREARHRGFAAAVRVHLGARPRG